MRSLADVIDPFRGEGNCPLSNPIGEPGRVISSAYGTYSSETFIDGKHRAGDDDSERSKQDLFQPQMYQKKKDQCCSSKDSVVGKFTAASSFWCSRGYHKNSHDTQNS